MIDTLFDTKDKRVSAISYLAQLKLDPGWVIIQQVLQANINIVKDLIVHGAESEDMKMITMLRERLAAYENLLNTPDTIINQLEGSKPVEPSMDPFLTLDQLKKMRKEAS